jgi:putative addiction module component (TIGR02574 family)
MLIEDALLTEANEIELSRAQIKEIRRRVAAHQADPASAIPWKDVSARVKKQLKELGE